MGVPKFFKFISERYPCLSELVKEYQIPEFDNLYLDMNGIIHMCSHPDDFDPHFRISEEKIFQDIFHYIEVLFRLIKPQKLFFMAIDGVAPRAKMNQQRGRRFRSAKDAEILEAKAKAKGEALPSEARFDSNCITPGTVFMARLHDQLKYFVTNKISSDRLWRKCKVILSGHETPGEGEHKIMDYIRYMRAQPGYDPNTRHCLYGLDADLIMLGLCSHEPHFSLLREEVRFGKKSTKRKSAPEQITFFLLHLSLMREYLELEFLSLKENLPFEYDMEKIIDDWVLMGFLVGNDFIPHLPNLHIANGALPVLYNAYMKVLPSLDGYINEDGKLNLERFEKFMGALSEIDLDNFTEHYADLKYFEAKTGHKWNSKESKEKDLEPWTDDEPNSTPMNKELADLIKATEDCLEPSVQNLNALALNDNDEENSINESDSCSDIECEEEDLKIEFRQHKRDYYMNKLEYAQVTPDVLRSQAEGYVRAIQWNLNYYYNGVCSWSWYYPHHYAPYISDIKGFANLKLEFDMGQPFKPYEQLLAVLPAASKNLLPEPYHELMTSENSIIKEYYPLDFKTDLNGKKQEWEAVVLIPFISENLLLEAMDPCNKKLNLEEIKRNTHGPMLVYTYIPEDLGEYKAPEYFPTIKPNHAKLITLTVEDVRVPQEKLVKGAYPGVKLDLYFPGFPTMKHLKYKPSLEKAKVKVFETPSRGENMMLEVLNEQEPIPLSKIANELIGKTIHVAWPHLVEAVVEAISDENYRYERAATTGGYNVIDNKEKLLQQWHLEKSSITNHYKERLGVKVGQTKVLVHVKPMVGRKYVFNHNQGGGRINFEKQWANMRSVYPYQTIVRSLNVYDEDYKSYRNLEEVFPIDSKCFMLGQPHYGSMGIVMDSTECTKFGRIKIQVTVFEEPDLLDFKKSVKDLVRYMPGHVAATRLAISPHLLSRITGTIFIIPGTKTSVMPDNSNKINIGLNLKFNKKNEEIPGYTKKEENQWLYSEKAVELVLSYIKFASKLIQYLNSNLSNDVYFEEEIFNGNCGVTLKEVTEWIKQQPYSSIERKPSGSVLIEPDVVTKLEEYVDKYNENGGTTKPITMQVKPHLLFKPELQMGNIAPDPDVEFQLYDRVVNVRESHTVPYGYKGTVIGIHKPVGTSENDITYDVLFDKPFPGGLQCNCSPNRGYTVGKPALINISYGIREVQKKAGKTGQLRQTVNARMGQQNTQPQPYFPQKFGCSNSAFASCTPGYNQYPNNRPFVHPLAPPHMHQQQAIPSMQFNHHNNFMPNFRQPMMPNQFNQHPFNKNQQNDFNGFMQKNKPGPSAAGYGPPSNVPPFGTNQKPFGQQNKQHVGTSPSKKVQHQVNNQTHVQENKNETDILKKLLKIDESGSAEIANNKTPSTRQQPSTNKEVSTSISVQEIFARAAELKEAKETSSPFCSIQLLELFQRNGYGIPRYNYVTLPNKLIEAVVALPNGESITGSPCASKDGASESAAKLAMEKLKANSKNGQIILPTITNNPPNIPPNNQHPPIPIPPKKWRQKLNHSNNSTTNQPILRKHSNTDSGQTQMTILHRPPTNNSGPSNNEKHLSPFVPLQAVKQHRRKQDFSGSASANKEHAQNDENKVAGANSSAATRGKINSPKKSDNHSSSQYHKANSGNSKPKVQRKSRIAANFGKTV